MSVVYVLTIPILEDGDDATVEQLRKRAKWDNDDYVCRGLIHNDFKLTLKHLKEELNLIELVIYALRSPSGYNDNKGKRKHHNNTRDDPNKKAKSTCWKCGKTGHIKRDCKGVNVGNTANSSGTKGLVDGSSNSLKGHNMFNKSLQIYYVTYVSEAYFVQDDDIAWWVDSRATVHVCKDRCWFKTYESLNDGYILHMGNESITLGHRRGCIDLRFTSRKIISLFNVLHVFNIRKNLVSNSILNNCGYKQVIESNKFVLSKHGVFIGFGYLSNQMFKLNIINDNIASAFMSTFKLNDSILWHARLGHVHFKRMQDMSKDGMELYMKNREHERIILESFEHGLLIWPMIEENGMTRTKKHAKLFATKKIQADCDLMATNIILQGLPSDVYSLVNHHRVAKDLWEIVQLLMQEKFQVNTKFLNSLPPEWCKFMTDVKLIDSGLAVPVFKQGDDPIDAINKMKSFLSTVVTSRFLTTNNQLRNYSNPRQQATIHDGRVTVQPLQMRPNSNVACSSRTRANTSGIGGRTLGEQRVVKCFNFQKEGHIAR
nr:zinc finger, CCHC-type [Tanacetum cinerariifolium]